MKDRKKKVDISLQDIKSQWEAQQGVCLLTGWKMQLMENTSPSKQLPLTPDRASLDRIDSRKGYEKGNIRFVAYMAQCAKNVFDDKDLTNFCEAVVQYKGQSSPTGKHP